MMKKLPVLAVLCLTVLGAASCSSPSSDKNLKIATTFAPVYDFAKRIAGDKAEILTIVGDNEPNDFSPNSPKISAFCEKADLLLAYGHGMDPYAEAMNEDAYRLVTDGVNFIETECGEDPHAWLGIKEAEKMLKNTCDAIASADPENRDFYVSNCQNALGEFEAVYAEGKELLKDDIGKAIVTSHDAFAYFASDYGLTQYSISDIADHEVSATRIDTVIQYIKANNLHTIFVEELDSVGYVAQIKSELEKENYAVELKELSAYESVSEEEYPDGNDYLSVYKEDLKELSECLKA